jgi:hypothetical protein
MPDGSARMLGRNRIGRPLMAIPLATTASRTGTTGTPALFGPSPETSMARRSPAKPLLSNCAAPKPSAPEIDVPIARLIGAAASLSAKAAASAALRISVHGASTT